MSSTALIAKRPASTTTEVTETPAVTDTTTSDALLVKTDELLDEITKLLTTNKIEELRGNLTTLGDKAYTLADAIREGSSCTSQKFGGFVGESGETMCALSAAMLAIRARKLA